MDKDRFCVDIDSTFYDAMQVIENIRERGVIIMDNDKVCGVLTLGDIIRALVEGRNIYAKIDKLYTPNFLYLQEYDLEKAFEIFKKRNLSLIPVIDKEYHLVDVIIPRDIMHRLHFE